MTSRFRAWSSPVRRALEATALGVPIALCALVSPIAFVATAYCLLLFAIGIGVVVLPLAIRAVQRLCTVSRVLAGRCGVRVTSPYWPGPERIDSHPVQWTRRWRWILADPATWRDMLWLLLNSVIGFVALAPAAALYCVVEGVLLAAGLWRPILQAGGSGTWFLGIQVRDTGTALTAGALATAVLVLWLYVSPLVLKVHAYFTRSLLGPTKQAELASRIRHLAETRSDALETQAAELRRIERDLHDGAQARLVGLGMTLGAVERHLDTDPAAARRLLREARESSVVVLRELRDLVRGIHPPVLAERGLADALHALGLASPLRVDVATRIDGQVPKPVETAMYFSVAELLANALKHSSAHHVSIAVWHENAVLHAHVDDDGHGGADDSRGTGLAGIRGRLAKFDGSMEIESPSGGPTTTRLEIPCALSSPKTSSC